MRLSRLENALLYASRGPFLAPDDGNGNGGGTSDDSANAGGQSGDKSESKSDGEITFSPEQQRFLSNLVSRERKAAAEKATADAKAAADAAAEQSRKDKEAEDAKKAGDFEKVETTLKADVEKFKSEATSLQAQLDQYKSAMETGLNEQWAKLPDAVRKLGEKQHGEDDVLGRFAFLHDPDTEALVTELAGKSGETPRGNGRDPRSTGNAARSVEDEAKALNRTGSYAM